MVHSFNDIILRIGWGQVYASDFSSSAAPNDGWASGSTHPTEGFTYPESLRGEDDAVKLQANESGNSSHYMSRSLFTIGKIYTVSARIYIPSDAPNLDSVRFHDGYGVDLGDVTTQDKWVTFTTDAFVATTDLLVFYGMDSSSPVDYSFVGAASPKDRFYIKDIVVREQLSGVGPSEIYCSSADINANVEIGGRNTIAHPYSSDYFSTSPTRGEINISYYLTGVDPIVDLIKSSSPVSIELGGFVVNSGYLGKYEFQLKQYDPINVSVTFAFFEKPKGSFTTNSVDSLSDNRYFLSTADVSLDNGLYIAPDQVNTLSYSYSANVTPKFVVEENASLDEVALKGVVHGVPKLDVSLDTYSYDVSLPASGIASKVEINLRDEHGNKKLKFDVNGVVRSQTMTASAGSSITQKISLAQGNIGGDIAVLDDPAFPDQTWGNLAGSIQPGEQLTIAGSKMNDVDKVSFMGFSCEVQSRTLSAITILIPHNLPNSGTAPFILYSPAGQSMSSTSLMVTGDGTLDLF